MYEFYALDQFYINANGYRTGKRGGSLFLSRCGSRITSIAYGTPRKRIIDEMINKNIMNKQPRNNPKRFLTIVGGFIG